MRVIECHSGANTVDPLLLDNGKIPYMWSQYLYHVGSSLWMHSIIHSGLIAGGKDTKEGRQAVFFTAVNPMTDSQEDEPLDARKPRKVLYRTKWKVFQDALCWINLRNAQDKGSELWQTRFNAIIYEDSVPVDCVERVVHTQN